MMRFGLALAAAAAVLGAPLSATAQAPAKTEAPKPYEKAQLEKGAKEGPAVLAKSALKCTSTGFAFAGQGTVKDTATKKDVKQSVYEVSCSEGLGYSMIETAGAGSVQTYDCLTLADAASQVKCRLPANLDVKAQLQPLVAATGRTCTVSGGRSIGATKAGEAFYEAACQGAEGIVITTTAAAKPAAQDCAAVLGSPLECKLTSKEQILAAQKAKLTALISKAGRGACAVSGTRTVGRLTNGEDLYEVACGPTGGFMLTSLPDGSNVKATDCGKANSYAGGCQLTNSAVAQTNEVATYTRLAKASGYDCNVSKYNYLGLDQNKAEVVELACSNRPDGGIALFPSDNSRGVVYDCVAAGTLGQRCQFSSPDAVYAKYTQALATRGRTTCKVSNARWIGRYEKEKSDLIETGCADGQPGWVVELANSQVKNLLSCGQAKASGVACQLPGNTK